MRIGVLVGWAVGLAFGVVVGSTSMLVASEPIRASFLGWLLFCSVGGGLTGGGIEALLRLGFRR